MILSGRFAAGTRLPTEAALCEKFAVSRSTVREALRILSSQRMLSTSRGVKGGSTVLPMRHQDVSGILQTAISLLAGTAELSVAELLQARELLEVPAVRLAATERTPEQLSEIKALIPRSLDGLSADRLYEVNGAFHKAILDATQNRLLRSMTEPVFVILRQQFARELAAPDFWRQVMHEHELVAAAIEERDGDRAAREMTVHLARLRGTYEQIYRASQVRKRSARH